MDAKLTAADARFLWSRDAYRAHAPSRFRDEVEADKARRAEAEAAQFAEVEATPALDLIIANTRSKKFYRPGDKGYRRAGKSENIEAFTTERQARAAGYRREDKKRRS